MGVVSSFEAVTASFVSSVTTPSVVGVASSVVGAALSVSSVVGVAVLSVVGVVSSVVGMALSVRENSL